MCVASALILCGNPEKIGRTPGRGGSPQSPPGGLHPAPFHLPGVRKDPTAMSLSIADVHRIAHLARIEIDAGEAEEVRAKLDAIFALINELAAVDTTGVEPMAHAQDVTLALRDDGVTEPAASAAYQRVAPSMQDGLYLVPKVIE